MKTAEFRKLVAKHFNLEHNSKDTGLSAFARWLQVGPRTVFRWANDEIPIPQPVVRLLQVIERGVVDGDMLAKIGDTDV